MASFWRRAPSSLGFGRSSSKKLAHQGSGTVPAPVLLVRRGEEQHVALQRAVPLCQLGKRQQVDHGHAFGIERSASHHEAVALAAAEGIALPGRGVDGDHVQV